MRLRLLLTLWLARLRPRIALFDTAAVPMRVWPGDLDINLHLNNARYLLAADLGRLDWWVRAGWWGRMLRHGWTPVAGDVSARYSRSLQPFERYSLQTRLLGWDDKWFFIEHRFVVGARICAVVTVRYLLLARHGERPRPIEALRAFGVEQAAPRLPDWVAQWDAAQDQLSSALKNNHG